jgi:hypothetical protein
MSMTPQEYERAMANLKQKLASHKEEREAWLNGIVDSWVARKKTLRSASKKP